MGHRRRFRYRTAPAIVEVRRMPFSISSLAIGRFGEKCGTSLAMLSGDGNIHRLEPSRKFRASNIRIPSGTLAHSQELPYTPTDADGSRYVIPIVPSIAGTMMDAAGNPLVDHNELKLMGRDEYLKGAEKRLRKVRENSRPMRSQGKPPNSRNKSRKWMHDERPRS